MYSFKNRSFQKELLYSNYIAFEDIRRNMQELDFINTWLGGHRITLKGFQSLSAQWDEREVLSVLEIGCGGGDNLRIIRDWAGNKNMKISLTGVDINRECILYAESLSANKEICFICCDYKDYIPPAKPHIIFSSLFCHHFNDDELVYMLKWMKNNAYSGFFINDLHRHSIAYYSIKILTKLFSQSYLIKHDAPLSVKRGFIRKDWLKIFKTAGIDNFNCNWKWAFRWLITYNAYAR